MHAHEIVFRSHGGDPTNPDEILGLCGRCHLDLHVMIGGSLKKIVVGQVDETAQFFERPNGKASWRQIGEE